MNKFFNAHHSPIGAFASFTLGFPGAKGGIAQELGKPANQNIYIGLQDDEQQEFTALPFYKPSENKLADFANFENKPYDDEKVLKSFLKEDIERDYQLTTDTWSAGDLTFSIISPVQSVPNPDTATVSELQNALLPAVFVELTVDNTKSQKPRRAFFGYQGNDPYSAMRFLQDSDIELTGIAQGNCTAIVSCDSHLTDQITTASGLSIEHILFSKSAEVNQFSIGTTKSFLLCVPAGVKQTFRFAVCFHRAGIVTSGLAAKYFYNRFFETIEDVAKFAKKNHKSLIKSYKNSKSLLGNNKLSENQRFMLIHATRSYYGSTQLLDVNNAPLWVVNEGEYRMMNTFDLTADHLFFELKMNSWVVKNVLNMFVQRYSYQDEIHNGDGKMYPGGISFCHDMGVANVFSKPQHSSYEVFGNKGLFSHMTCEQLVNWICCATTYTLHTKDFKWAEQNLTLFEACLSSLINRDHPNADSRDGVMSFNSSRTLEEITTYDSLDASLGQACRNIYLASKTWASYILLHSLFSKLGKELNANSALQQANLLATTLSNSLNKNGFIPAVLDENSQSKIIPVIEGLVFPYVSGCLSAIESQPETKMLFAALKQHFNTVINNGCLFDDGGWKLSSTSDNSWLSKIYLSQFIARKILKIDLVENTQIADSAHTKWLTDEQLSYWAWSDQIVAGKISASKYYPRGVTSWLWLQE
ncbi:glycoside hydrolase family 52 protein [Pseudomonadota bacterium]